MQSVWMERPTWPFSAATCRRVERAGTLHHSVNSTHARQSGWKPVHPEFNGMVPTEEDRNLPYIGVLKPEVYNTS